LKVANLFVTAELLAQFVFASRYHNGLPRRFFVLQNPLPDDVSVIGVYGTETPGVIRLLLKSESFDDIPDGAEIPNVPDIFYRTVYDTNYDINGPVSNICVTVGGHNS
jgi:hypothetical protein